MSKWFGEVKEWTDSEKDFMVKAACMCRGDQEAGLCKWGSKECCQCKWQAPMAAIKELDSFTQSRIEDKADTLAALLKAPARKSCNAKALLLVAAAAAIAFIALAVCFSMSCSSTGVTRIAADEMALKLDDKWCVLPPAPKVPAGWSYQASVSKCLSLLKDRRNVRDWTGEGSINCRDWTMSFLVAWYIDMEQPDGTCFVVWNDDYTFFGGNSWSHMFVAVWGGSSWQMVEPQAASKKWLVSDVWGKKYNKSNNLYNMTVEAVSDMAKAPWPLRQEIIRRTNTVAFYGKHWWKD